MATLDENRDYNSYKSACLLGLSEQRRLGRTVLLQLSNDVRRFAGEEYNKKHKFHKKFREDPKVREAILKYENEYQQNKNGRKVS